MLIPAHKSQRRNQHKLFCWSSSREHFLLLFEWHRPRTAAASDYVIIMGTPRSHDASCRLYCGVMDSKCNRWGLDSGAKPDLSRIAADTYLVEPRLTVADWSVPYIKEQSVDCRDALCGLQSRSVWGWIYCLLWVQSFYWSPCVTMWRVTTWWHSRPPSSPSRVEHDVHEQRGHRGQRVRVQAGHTEHVTGAGQRVDDGPGHCNTDNTQTHVWIKEAFSLFMFY